MLAGKVLIIFPVAGVLLVSEQERRFVQTLSVSWTAQAGLRPGEVFRDRLKNGREGPEMVVIPAGKFRMGDIQAAGTKNEQPVREAHVQKQFAISRYEITFEQYDEFAKATAVSCRTTVVGVGAGGRSSMFHGKTRAIMPHGCRSKRASAIGCLVRPNGSMSHAQEPRLPIGGGMI